MEYKGTHSSQHFMRRRCYFIFIFYEDLFMALDTLLPACDFVASAAAEQAPSPARDTIIIIGAGPNTEHMSDALRQLDESGYQVHFLEIGEPSFDIAGNRLHRTDTLEGKAETEALYASRRVSSIYLSVPPIAHLPLLKQAFERIAAGQAERVIVPKPAVQDLREMRQVDAMLAATEARMREHVGDDYDFQANPLLCVHEHYQTKDISTAAREKMPEMTQLLGRLESVEIDIREERTAEREGRTLAYAGGAIEDLAPHALTLAMDACAGVNASGRYTIDGRPETTAVGLRYADSELASDVATGFVATGVSRLTDHERNETHEVTFAGRCGKGLEDCKQMSFTFVDPTSGERSVVRFDLAANSVMEAPEAVRQLFGDREYRDNGYRDSIAAGLRGENVQRNLQSWHEARLVTAFLHRLVWQRRRTELIHHGQGTAFEQVAASRPDAFALLPRLALAA